MMPTTPSASPEPGHTTSEWLRIGAWTSVDLAVIGGFALVAQRCWYDQPLALFVLPVLFGGTLVLLVAAHDWCCRRLQ